MKSWGTGLTSRYPPLPYVNGGSTFALRHSTLGFCLGGQRSVSVEKQRKAQHFHPPHLVPWGLAASVWGVQWVGTTEGPSWGYPRPAMTRTWSHFVANCCQKLTNLVKIDFEIPPRRALRGPAQLVKIFIFSSSKNPLGRHWSRAGPEPSNMASPSESRTSVLSLPLLLATFLQLSSAFSPAPLSPFLGTRRVALGPPRGFNQLASVSRVPRAAACALQT